MHYLTFILMIFTVILNIFLYKTINRPLVNISEVYKCPFCFGKDFCEELDHVILKKTSIADLFANYVSVKNVFYARYKNKSVVLKKLASDFELSILDELLCVDNGYINGQCNFSHFTGEHNYEMKIIQSVTNSDNEKIKNFKACSTTAVVKFLNLLLNYNKLKPRDVFLKNVWTIVQLNVEPLLLQIFRFEDKWPVPLYIGSCGRLIIENDCGTNLNTYSNAAWKIRAYLALQLLEAAKDFTEKHSQFRLYLTDISPDNIAVNDQYKITFVDLENVIIMEKSDNDTCVHNSENFGNSYNFVYSEEEICESSISDHNYYAVCKLLLSKHAPWPMMESGLLHSPPNSIVESHQQLFLMIEECAVPSGHLSRFAAAQKIIHILKQIWLE